MYEAVLFSTDGIDYVTDYKSKSIQDTWEAINNAGSRWFFYPIPFIVKDSKTKTLNKRILDIPDCFTTDMLDNNLRGKSIKTAMQWIANNQPYIKMILS